MTKDETMRLTDVRRKTLVLCVLTCAAIGLLPCAATLASTRLDASDGGGAAVPVEAGRRFSMVRLAPVDGSNDEAAQIQAAAARAKDLASAGELAGDGLAQVGLLLEAVNTTIGLELEPFCTRRILSLDPPPGVDAAIVGESMNRANAWLAAVDKKVSGARDSDGSLPATWSELGRRASTLAAFAAAERAFLLAKDGEEATRERRQVASLLSPALEDDDPRIAASANLWLACVRGEEDSSGRALSTLELPLAEPAKGSLPHAFFSRLVKCRLLATRGHPAAAISILQQLEDRSLDWFTNDADRSSAERAAALVRWQVLDSWQGRLAPGAADDERRWCEEAKERIRREHFDKPEPTVLRLRPAVPFLGREGAAVGAGETRGER